jgi:hypothetical protein
MEVTIDIEPKTYSLLKKIEEKGISLDDILTEALRAEDDAPRPKKNGSKDKKIYELSAEERIKHLREWANTPRDLPPFNEEMLKRENIYEDRG